MIEFRVSSFKFRVGTRNPRPETRHWQPRPTIRRYSVLLPVFFAAAFAWLPGCGKKGDPKAPELSAPQTIRDLKAEAGPKGIALTWGRPTRYMDGRELRDLAAFVIFRKEISKACPECPVPYRERVTLSVEDQERFIKKRQFRFVDQELAPEITYRYRVFSQLRDGSLGEPSNEVEVVWRP